MTHSFQDFNLPDSIKNYLNSKGYTTPTEIQIRTLPLSLAGRDLLATATTGSGKTLAFMLPAVAMLLQNPNAQILVLAPTRELAQQVKEVFDTLVTLHRDLRAVLLIGGAPYFGQLSTLKRNPRIIIGTPGRVNDHLKQGSLNLSRTQMFILDEADRMLDVGFGEQLDAIAEHIPSQRQTLMFSATLPKSIIQLSKRFLKDPEMIAVGERNQPSINLKQATLFLREDQKYATLLTELEKRTGTVLIFVNAKFKTERIADQLSQDLSSHVGAMHGDLRQKQRQWILQKLRDQKIRIMVATDVAARGLDIPHIEHVINYDLPQSPEDYVHRVGRTARAGAQGEALCLISDVDRNKWRAIQKILKGEDAPPEPSFRGRNRSSGSSFRPQSNSSGSSWKSKSRRPSGGRATFSEGRTSSDRPARSFRSEGGASDRPARHFKSEAGPFERRDNRTDPPARSFRSEGGTSDRPARHFKSEAGPFERRDNRTDRPARSFRSEGGASDRPARHFKSEAGPFERRDNRTDRPARSFRSEGGAPDRRDNPRNTDPRHFNSENKSDRRPKNEGRSDRPFLLKRDEIKPVPRFKKERTHSAAPVMARAHTKVRKPMGSSQTSLEEWDVL